MRKIFALILAVLMLAALPVSALATAETGDVNDGAGSVGESMDGSGGEVKSTSINVTGKYVAGEPAADVVSVDVSWGAMEFTYSEASEGSWDPSTHSYQNATPASWTGSGNNIDITNHSNVGITASFTFTKAQGSDITGAFSADTLTLERAEDNSALDSRKASVTFTVTAGKIDGNADLGTITVTIAKASA